MEFNARKYAEKMRDSKNLNLDGNVVCPLEVWEHTATMLEEQADEIDRLLNFMCKIDREQEERIQEEYVPYEQYEEILEENKSLKYKLEETYLSAEGLRMENVKLKEENKQLRAKQTFVAYKGARGSGKSCEMIHLIRCKDCKYCHHNEVLNTYRCTHFNCIMKPEDYCSWGERDEVR